MNDFFELENELKKLRPAQPSPVLFERVEEALENCRASAVRRQALAAFHRNALQLVVVRLRPRSCGGFGFVRGNQYGTPAGARRKNHGNFACTRNKPCSACAPGWERRIHIFQSIYPRWRDAGCL